MTRHRGTVAEFDEQVGLGIVTDVAGTPFPFHCTQIADGSRSIPAGATVEFGVVASHGGRWEAVEVRPLGWRGSP